MARKQQVCDLADKVDRDLKLSGFPKAYDYWEASPSTIEGVLGGYGELSPIDIAGSTKFLAELKSLRPGLGCERAADCGAGIGRITRDFLLQHFDAVDMVEQSPKLLEAAPRFLGPLRDCVEYICMGLQDFCPPADTYDVIWVQWVVGHLTDVDFVKFLRRCRQALRPHGVLVLKDNCCSCDGSADAPDGTDNSCEDSGGNAGASSAFVLDSDDSSVARSVAYFRSLFKHADMDVVLQRREASIFPEEIFPVFYFALE
ncbi:AdoMet dependent proline di-methyltransferase-domain-containing protein [Tribonema minus]|uniref:Alpha N-terminal protein methyltransferase 1 n=1 Tax=Tribonema minus TaxID=303371 RepID=A0A836CCK3_9STRA|nr:AdoMet dependent proline di-methyltransferase-domain-containing protein [Tribonema minus]